MSVIVMGMKMPGTCIDCDLYDKHYRHGMCKGHGVLFGPEDDWKYETRPNWCPLRPLPEKHGPLIDRTELEKAVLKWLPPDPCGRAEMEYPFETDICVSMMMEIEEQETIVEAEGEEMEERK